MVNLKRISNSGFTLLALCVAQRLMAQQPFWLPVLAPELSLADKQTAIADGNSLFLSSTQDKLELLFIAELSAKSSSDDDSVDSAVDSSTDQMPSSEEQQQEHDEEIKNELAASSNFDHMGEHEISKVDMALPYAVGLFASWLMKVDQSMGMLTAKSITAGLLYASHQSEEIKSYGYNGGSSGETDHYSLSLWFDAPGSSKEDFIKAIENITTFNSNNVDLQIDAPLVYLRSPYLTGTDSKDNHYYDIYWPENLKTILDDNASGLNPGFYFDISSFQCEKSPDPDPDPSKDCVSYTSTSITNWPANTVKLLNLGAWGTLYDDTEVNSTPIQSALAWFYDFYQQYQKPFVELVIEPEGGGADVKLVLQYIQNFLASEEINLQDKIKIGTTLGLDEWNNTVLFLTGTNAAGHTFTDPIQGNVYIQVYDKDWNYWLRGYDKTLVKMEDAAENLYNMMKLIPCNSNTTIEVCSTNKPIMPLSDPTHHFGNVTYANPVHVKPGGIEYTLTVSGLHDLGSKKIQDIYDEITALDFYLQYDSGKKTGVLKSTTDPVFKDSELTINFNSINDLTNFQPKNLLLSEVAVNFSGINASYADHVKFMFSFEDGLDKEAGPFFSGANPADFKVFLDQFYTLSQPVGQDPNPNPIFGDATPLAKNAFALYEYSILHKDESWIPSADDMDGLSF